MSFFSKNEKAASERAVEDAVLKLKKTCQTCSGEFRAKLHYKKKLQVSPDLQLGQFLMPLALQEKIHQLSDEYDAIEERECELREACDAKDLEIDELDDEGDTAGPRHD